MSDGTLASAVTLPDQDNVIQSQSQQPTTKRRNSSITDNDSKRRRLSADGETSPQTSHKHPNDRKPVQRSGKEDERKRGQRLFGGLLGTLSQSSTSAAQKRRADIEKRQQDKLKSQAQEFDGLQSRRKERREAIRRKEMPFYEREIMQTRHSNMVAAAHFLKTRTQPVLFYKPWQLRARDEAIIAEQIKDAEATVSREVADFEARFPPEAFVYQPEPKTKNEQPVEQQEQQQQQQPPQSSSEDQQKMEPITEDHSKSEYETTKRDLEGSGNKEGAQNTESSSNSNNADASNESVAHVAEANRAADDDGGEVVEDNEDTVIY